MWLKLNCEGAECDIIDHLLNQDAMSGIDHLLVHFDVEKVPSMAHRADATTRRDSTLPASTTSSRRIMFGRSHAAKTANWLAWTEAEGVRRLRYTHLNRLTFRTRQLLYPLKVRCAQWQAHRNLAE